MPIIDAHVHVWDSRARRHPWLDDEPELNRPYTLDDHRVASRDAADGVILVQADAAWSQAFEEAEWLASLAGGRPEVHGVVAGVRLEAETAARDLTRLAGLDLVRGVRRLIQDEGAGFALRPGFVAGVRALARHDLAMELCVRQHQLAEVTQLVRQCPDVRFVLDHAGKPDIAGGGYDAWSDDLAVLARCPNVVCKVSGLVTEADAGTLPEVPRYVRRVLDVFGPQRSMFGSDWPVCTTVVGWQQWFDVVDRALAGYTADERDAVLGGNARRVYLGADREAAGRP